MEEERGCPFYSLIHVFIGNETIESIDPSKGESICGSSFKLSECLWYRRIFQVSYEQTWGSRTSPWASSFREGKMFSSGPSGDIREQIKSYSLAR